MLRQIIHILLYSLCYFSLAYADLAHIIEFDDNHIEQALSNAEFSFIYFYSDGCKFCAQFEPEFEYLSVLYNNITQESKPLQILKTNAKSNKKLAALFNVNQYPTLKLLDFGTKEIIDYTDNRHIDYLVDFVQKQTKVAPNYDNFKSLVNYLHDDIDGFIQSASTDTLIVFTLPYLHEWSDYEYPSHFYQRLAYSEYRDTVSFALVDVTKLSNNDFLAKYEVSNYPSLIYFIKDNQFKTYNTLSKTHLTRDRLEYDQVAGFLEKLQDPDPAFGQWYNSYSEFIQNCDEKYQPVREIMHQGFNFRHGDRSSEYLTTDEDYNWLLDHVEL